MSFVARMAWRDTRAARRRLLLYSTTIVLGIASLVSIGSFASNARRTIGNEPRKLLGADLRIGLDAWPNPALQGYLASLGGVVARQKDFMSTLTAGKGEHASRQSFHVIAVDPAFPFYGDFAAQPADAVVRLKRGERVAILDPRVAETFGIGPGARIHATGGDYEVAGIATEVPGDTAFSLAVTGRVFVPWSQAGVDLPPGAPPNRGIYRIYVRLPESADVSAVAAEIKSRFAEDLPVVVTAPELGKQVEHALTVATDYFALVLFVALFLGAIGVASALHVYVQERSPTVAVLRCLGASARRATGVYLLQAAALGLCGSVMGALVGVGIQFALPPLTRDFFPVRLEVFFAWRPVLAGMGTGFATCLVFALLPLLAVRRIPPLAAVRSDAAEGLGRDPLRLAIWALIATTVMAFAYVETHSKRVAVGYALALAVAFGVFAAAAAAAAGCARRLGPLLPAFVLRQGVGSLHRPRNRTTLLLLSMGLGLFIVLTIYLVHATLKDEFSGTRNPNVILGEISDADGPKVLAAIAGDRIGVVRSIATIGLKLKSINDEPFEGEGAGTPPRAARRRHPAFNGNAVGTYRSELEPYETLVAGRLTPRAHAGDKEIPITVAAWMVNDTFHGSAVFHLGDVAEWDIEGVPIRTRVAGVRRMEGLHFEPNFPVVFPTGAVDAAPAKTLLYLRSPSAAATARLSTQLGSVAPRVRMFDITAMLVTVERLFAKAMVVVDFVAFYLVATGMIILASAVIAGRHQRARESVLLRTLGATRLQLRIIQTVEYGSIGLLAGAVGCGLALAANGLLATLVFKVPPSWGLAGVAATAAGIVASTVVIGVAADRGASRLPPLEILRQET